MRFENRPAKPMTYTFTEITRHDQSGKVYKVSTNHDKEVIVIGEALFLLNKDAFLIGPLRGTWDECEFIDTGKIGKLTIT